jgi:ribonuclease HII
METICGIDEAGRGPLAGPVTAAAVVLPHDFNIRLLADSKSLGTKKREAAAEYIMKDSIWAVGWSWPEEIDALNIHNATLLAMKRAYRGVGIRADKALVDGLFTPSLSIPCEAVVKGDTSIPEIMAASIVAKVLRDRWMVRYSWIETEYGFENHKGYPTKFHRDICTKIGLSPIHRKSFKVSPS